MQYGQVIKARFLSRPNRFIAHVEASGETITAHVKNTGRCRELLTPGATVYLERAENPNRKTGWSLIAVEKGARLINMDSAAPNKIVEEALRGGWKPSRLSGEITELRRETVYGGSRFDLSMRHAGTPLLMEVKGVTLEEDGAVYFPDAPTQRGVKHLRHLTAALEEGFQSWIVFVVQMADISHFSPNDRTHPAFGEALRQAASAGVEICACTCRVTPDHVVLDGEIPVIL